MNLESSDALPNRTGNRLLAALPRMEYAQLHGALRSAALVTGDCIQPARQAVREVWFPVDCLLSVRAEISPGGGLEVGLVGSEGVVGIAGGRNGCDSILSAIVQNSGSAFCIEVRALKRQLPSCPQLQQALYLSMHGLMMQASQNAVCSHYHLLEARLARSLLATRDRLQMSEFHLTHEFLGQALGVRRVGVTKAATALQIRNLIRYTRGAITVIDGPGLEQAACACYQLDQSQQRLAADESLMK